MRVSYEALAWGRHVNTYERSWEIVRRADHPALGLCVDSFHILSRGSDPAGIRDIPGEKLFFLQLADAPHMNMDVLQWSRHHRLFPGQGAFDLPAFLGHVLAAGYTGPLSLEVFNDVFRQSDPRRAAVDALRRCWRCARRPATRLGPPAGRRGSAAPSLPPTPGLHGFAFAELAVDADVRRGRRAHPRPRSGSATPAAPQQAGAAVAAGRRPGAAQRRAGRHAGAAVAALGVETDDPAAAPRTGAGAARPGPAPHPRPGRGRPVRRRRAGRDRGVLLPHRRRGRAGWPTSRRTGAPDGRPPARSRTSTTSRSPSPSTTSTRRRCSTAACSACSRSTPRRSPPRSAWCATGRSPTPARRVRLGLSVSVLRRGEWAPGVADPQHVAFACTDDVSPPRARPVRRGAPLLAIPDNYYDDLDARLAPPPDQLATMRELGVLLRPRRARRVPALLHRGAGRAGVLRGRAAGGRATPGYGEVNAPIRMAAHRRAPAVPGR